MTIKSVIDPGTRVSVWGRVDHDANFEVLKHAKNGVWVMYTLRRWGTTQIVKERFPAHAIAPIVPNAAS